MGLPLDASAQNVLTYKYDNFRSGANTNEIILTLANVNVNQFSKLFTYALDGYVYSQPLYVSNLTIPGQGTHNVVFVGTENDSVYAFDADSNVGPNGGLLWHTNLGIAQISVNNYGVRYHHNVLNPLIGITGTPVIDPVSGTLYVDTFCGVIANTNNGFHLLHALSITNGAERPYSPVLVTASVPGRGVDATNGIVMFAGQNQMNRPALTLVGGTLFLAFGSYGDTDPFHGWVIGYNATNLVQLTNYVFATTPNATTNDFGVNAGEGAIWMGGDGLCVDANTNLYFETGNGSFSANTNGGDYGDSFVKLSTTNQVSQFTVADYFTPWNQASMAVGDQDLGSGGPILLPDSAGSVAHPHLIIGAGKEGTLYLLDRDNLGHFNATNDNQIVQELHGAIGGLFGSADYFNNLIFFQGSGDVMKAFRITNGVMTTAPVSQSATSFSSFMTPSISANGTNDAIAWAIQTDAFGNNGPAVLHAYNATNLAQELYNSSQNLNRDNPGGAIKYAVPVVANGRVFVGAEYALSVFGVGTILPPPTISPNGGIYTNSVLVTLADATNGTTIYYTLDGTEPTTSSRLYTVPFILTNTTAVNAIAVQSGAFNSAVTSASFINSSTLGNGTGLLGSYWTNTTSAAFTNVTFAISPTLVRTDETVNFNFGSSGPAPIIGGTNYAVRWTGSVQPQFSEPYTFYTMADDGVRLYVNGRLLINDWADQPATTMSGTIMLKAQQLYNIELDYYYKTNDSNGAQVSLSWSSPSTPQAIIPQTQIYPYTNPPPIIILSSPANGSIYTAAASVSIAADADTPYNVISEVDFYANGSLFGTLSNSSDAPLYALTITGLNSNPGGETTNSVQVSATPSVSSAVVLTTTNVEAAGSDWTLAIWKTNGTGTAVLPVAGHAYAEIFNGVLAGNALNNARIRNPTGAASTFPGDSLTININCELREKSGVNGAILNFPGVNGNPGLVLNGGILNVGESEASPFPITGTIQVTRQTYISNGAGGVGGGLNTDTGTRQWNLAGVLGGTGNIVLINNKDSVPQIISGTSNTFSGQWIVQCGWLQGTNANSLGTNSITVDPGYNGYTNDLPQATSPSLTSPDANFPSLTGAIFEPSYNLNSAGTLTLVNGGQIKLHQNCTFAAVTIEGVVLSAGPHPYSELAANFPNNFLPGGSGSIMVDVPIAIPSPTPVPVGLSATAGNIQVSLSWNASLGATNYNVKRSTTNGGPYTTVASLTGTSYTNTGLVNGTTYYYVVSAISAPGYSLTAVATDGSGLSGTSSPVHITVNAGSELPYGLTNNGTVSPFLNMPTVVPAIFPGTLPLLLSGTGAFGNITNRTPASGLIPYVPNNPLWSDAAVKSRYMALPNHGGPITPDEQISFLPTNSWNFPAGTVFVKNFDLVVNEANMNTPLRRLETRLLVRDINGAVYGVVYKWRPDNSDADLLFTSLNEDILITNATGVRTQTWYYPSPSDCLTCHTFVANYILGVNTRQLNGNEIYPATGNTDNQLRTLNRLGLFNPAINEANVTNYAYLSALTNLSASLEQRARSYLDANCAQCHQPGGVGITLDARYDTPLANQNITNYPAQLSLGYDNACIVRAKDAWRSMLLRRINTSDPTIKMPTLARNLIDTNAVQVITDWINSLPGTPALAPPTITPGGGLFIPSVTVALQSPDTNATLYYTLNGTLPTTNSFVYTAPFLLTNSALLTANAFETNFNNSVTANALFTIQPFAYFTSTGFLTNGQFQLGFSGMPGQNYVLQATTNFVNWIPLSTNLAMTNLFPLIDSGATNFPYRFYRTLEQ